MADETKEVQETSEFQKVKESLKTICNSMLEDLNGRQSKASYKRVRRLTLEMNKVGKTFRAMSTQED